MLEKKFKAHFQDLRELRFRRLAVDRKIAPLNAILTHMQVAVQMQINWQPEMIDLN